MSTVFTQVSIGGVDRSADVLRVETVRTLNGVGNWMAVLRNVGNVYDGMFDVQDQFLVDVNGLGNTLMEGKADGTAVSRIGKDLESIWDEYVILRGVDQAQDLLFHNDFDYYYPDTAIATRRIKTTLDDIINTRLVGLTNITYAFILPDVSPFIGAIEFREGASFLGTLQEMFRTAGWLFYVDDLLALQSGAPGFSASGEILQSILNDPINNIIDIVEILDADGDKLYNWVKLYGKNPMFDGYTELNVTNVATTGWLTNPAFPNLLNDNATVRVGTWSQVAPNTAAGARVRMFHRLVCPVFNYTSWDFSKGDLGVWARYDNAPGAPGDPQAGVAPANEMAQFRLYDIGGQIADYYGASTRLYEDEWGWAGVTLGRAAGETTGTVPDEWYYPLAAGFDWTQVEDIRFYFPRLGLGGDNNPSHLYIDGITMPEPCIAIAEVAGGALASPYRKRPYIDSFPNFRTQNSLQVQADRFLAQHKDTGISQIKLITQGNQALRYAGQTVTIDIPRIGLNSTVAYMSEIRHIVEPYVDVSNGFGFDWITEVTAIPINGTVYDMGRLRDGPSYSAMQMGNRAAVGTRIK